MEEELATPLLQVAEPGERTTAEKEIAQRCNFPDDYQVKDWRVEQVPLVVEKEVFDLGRVCEGMIAMLIGPPVWLMYGEECTAKTYFFVRQLQEFILLFANLRQNLVLEVAPRELLGKLIVQAWIMRQRIQHCVDDAIRVGEREWRLKHDSHPEGWRKKLGAGLFGEEAQRLRTEDVQAGVCQWCDSARRLRRRSWGNLGSLVKWRGRKLGR